MSDKLEVARPNIEGSAAVRDGRRIGFCSFGTPNGRPVFWLHGTPGARRQVPLGGRALAEEHDLRIIGLDRPGIGSSTPHVYDSVRDFALDLELVADALGLDTFHVVGLSGGGPYALATSAVMPDRVLGLEVIGGVAPTVGPDATDGGVVELASRLRVLLPMVRVPLGFALTAAVRVLRPAAGPALDAYRLVQPAGDRRLLARPEFRAMFVDDLVNGSRYQMTAPISDIIVFTRDWGFRLGDVKAPVRWWHGDADHIVPIRHGRHCAERLPNAQFFEVPGESHLGGFAIIEDVLAGLLHE